MGLNVKYVGIVRRTVGGGGRDGSTVRARHIYGYDPVKGLPLENSGELPLVFVWGGLVLCTQVTPLCGEVRYHKQRRGVDLISIAVIIAHRCPADLMDWGLSRRDGRTTNPVSYRPMIRVQDLAVPGVGQLLALGYQCRAIACHEAIG